MDTESRRRGLYRDAVFQYSHDFASGKTQKLQGYQPDMDTRRVDMHRFHDAAGFAVAGCGVSGIWSREYFFLFHRDFFGSEISSRFEEQSLGGLTP